MKNFRRVIGLLLLLVFAVANIFVMPAFAAAFSDVPDTEKYAEAVNFLNSLGVIEGYEDGTFKPLNNVNRAEFTAMLLRYRGMGNVGDTSLENPPFPDVTDPDVSWAIGNIRTASSLGIVTGYEDGTFRPQDNVLLEEAVTMIIRALGYEGYSAEGVQWYTEYITSATKLGIMKNIDGVIGTPATRACIAQLLYNCNDVQVANNGNINIIGGGNNSGTGGSVLEDELNLTEATGIVYSNKNTSLTDPDVNLRDDELLIYNINEGTTDIYLVDNIDQYDDMLGCRVDFYYRYDRDAGGNVVTVMDEKKNNYLTLDIADIEAAETTSSGIAYYENGGGRQRKAAIDDDSIVIYNDKLYGSSESSSSFDDFLSEQEFPILGTIELIDNTGDNVYDVLFIDSYDVYVATSIISSSYTVTDTLTRTQPDNSIVLDEKKDDFLTFTDEDGDELSFSSIKKGSVLCIKKSNSENGGDVLTTVVICNDSVRGEVTGSSSDSVKIGSNTYEFSYAAPWMRSDSQVDLEQPRMGDSGTFYLDLNGDIVAYDRTEVSSNQQYGYIIKAALETKDMEENLHLRILTAKNGKRDYLCYDGTSINGTEMSYAEILEELQIAAANQGQNTNASNEDSTGYASQLIKFTTRTYDGQTVIDEILTAEEGSSIKEVTGDRLQMSDSFDAGEDAKYSSTSKQLKSGSATANLSNSVIFSIPDDRSDEDGYKIVSLSALTDGENYNAEVYDHTQANTAKVVVLYNLNANIGQVNNKTTTFVVTGISQESNPSNDDEVMYLIKGFKGNSKTETTVWGSPDTEDAFEMLSIGDVVRFGEDSSGFATFNENDILFSLNVSRDDIIAAFDSDDASLDGYPAGSERYFLNRTAQSVEVSAIWGYIYACDGDSLVILDKPLDLDTEEDVSEYSHSYNVSNLSNSLILQYNERNDFDTSVSGENDSLVISNSEASDILLSLPTFAGGVEPAEIFIFDVDDYPTVVVIVQ